MARTVYPVKCIECSWKGERRGYNDCECYEEWAYYCRPWSPGPGCPSWILWPCPRCKGSVTMDWKKYNKRKETNLDKLYSGHKDLLKEE